MGKIIHKYHFEDRISMDAEIEFVLEYTGDD